MSPFGACVGLFGGNALVYSTGTSDASTQSFLGVNIRVSGSPDTFGDHFYAALFSDANGHLYLGQSESLLALSCQLNREGRRACRL